MATSIGKWSAQASLDARGFQQGVHGMIAASTGAGTSIAAIFTGIQGHVAAAVAGLTRVISQLSRTLEQQLELGWLSDQLGTSVEWLSRMETAAMENSVSSEEFARGMESLNRMIGAARLGGEEAIATFQHLGISMDDLRGRSFEEQFQMVARALSNIEDRSVRARLALQLFQRGGARGMLRLIDNQGTAGSSLTESGLRALTEIDNAVDNLSTTWRNMWRDFLVDYAPEIIRTVQSVADILRESLALYRDLRDMVPSLGGEVGFSAPGILNNLMARSRPQRVRSGGRMDSPSQMAALQIANTPFSQMVIGWFNDLREPLRQFGRGLMGILERMKEAREVTASLRSPLERFRDRMAQLQNLRPGLTKETFARGAAQAFQQLLGDFMESPALGALEQGSQEVADILAHANDPQIDALEAMRILQERDQAQQQRNGELLQQILEALAPQGDIKEF